MTRFVMLGQQRTGSNYLVSLLGTHPGVCAFGELFSSVNNMQLGDSLRNVIESNLLAVESLKALRDAAPEKFLEQILKLGQRGPNTAVGFKFFYEQANFEAGRRAWQWILQHREMRVIHLKRRNIFRMLASKRIANRDQVWLSEEPLDQPFEPVSLGIQDCEEFLERTLVNEREAEYALRLHATLPVYYEELCADAEMVMRGVLAFLHLPPAILTSNLIKQNPRPLSDLIANLEELRQHFARRHYDCFWDA